MSDDKQKPPFDPYLHKAVYDWLVDQSAKIYITVLANYITDPVILQYTFPATVDPDMSLVTLNITPHSIGHIDFQPTELVFSCRFNGKDHLCAIPYDLVLVMYDANPEGEGQPLHDPQITIAVRQSQPETVLVTEPAKPRPKLSIVK